jgi:hypothetical protein
LSAPKGEGSQNAYHAIREYDKWAGAMGCLPPALRGIVGQAIAHNMSKMPECKQSGVVTYVCNKIRLTSFWSTLAIYRSRCALFQLQEALLARIQSDVCAQSGACPIPAMTSTLNLRTLRALSETYKRDHLRPRTKSSREAVQKFNIRFSDNKDDADDKDYDPKPLTQRPKHSSSSNKNRKQKYDLLF